MTMPSCSRRNDPVRTFDFAVQLRGAGRDVDVPKVLVEQVPVALRLDLGPVVGHHLLDVEGQLGSIRRSPHTRSRSPVLPSGRPAGRAVEWSLDCRVLVVLASSARARHGVDRFRQIPEEVMLTPW